jgi:hypothetical protein
LTNTYTVSLPVKPYVKRYVETVEGTPLQFNSKSMLCQIIRAFMQNKNYTGLSRTQLNTAISSRTATIDIILPIQNMYKIGTSVSPHGIMFINRFLEGLFEQALNKHVRETIRRNGRYKGFKEAYYSFAELYNIELDEDITYEGLQKMDYRFREKRMKNIFSTLVPSIFIK